MAAIPALSSGSARFEGGLREVAPRTWAWLQPNGGLGESNAGLVVGDGASLLVDTLWDERLTRRMLDAMAPVVADAPIRTTFITHPDGDHWWGNAVLPADVEVLATPACERAMRAEALPRVLDGMARTAALLRRAPGKVGAVARFGHAQMAPFAWRGVRLRHADRTVKDGATLEVGGREVRVLDLGPTHSPADAVVHVPDAHVAFTGDLLFIGVTPIMWHGPVETWLRALDALIALDADVFVPGHGPPCGRAEIEELGGYWRWLRDGVHEQRAASRSPGEAARELLRRFGHTRWAGWQSPERILVNVATMYGNLDGRPAGELSPPARARLLLQMWRVGAERARSDRP